MAKSDRKKLVKTQVINSTVILFRADTEAEIGRVNIAGLTAEMTEQTLIYGVKQIVSDVNAALEGEAKFEGITRACGMLNAGTWPARQAQPVSVDAAAELLAKSMGMSRDQMMSLLNARRA